MNCLDIPQHEGKRYKVLKGRELHEKRAVVNKDYLRQKIDCVNKEILVYLNSDRYHIRGIVDEVLTLFDGTMAPLDYKFAEYKDYLYQTHRIQSVLYGMLIKDNYGADVNRGYVCYLRSNNLLKEIPFTKESYKEGEEIVNDILKIIRSGYYPQKSKSLAKCIDCCYKNICV